MVRSIAPPIFNLGTNSHLLHDPDANSVERGREDHSITRVHLKQLSAGTWYTRCRLHHVGVVLQSVHKHYKITTSRTETEEYQIRKP